MLNMSANLQQNPSSYYLEKLKKESQQEQQQQQQSGVSYRAATKVAAKNVAIHTMSILRYLVWKPLVWGNDGYSDKLWDGLDLYPFQDFEELIADTKRVEPLSRSELLVI